MSPLWKNGRFVYLYPCNKSRTVPSTTNTRGDKIEMPKEHDPYPCADKLFSLYWKLIDETQYDPDMDDFESAEKLRKAIEQLQQIKDESEIKT